MATGTINMTTYLAKALAKSGTTGQFYRGDQTWSNILEGTLWADYYGSSASISSRLTSLDFAFTTGVTGRTKMRIDLATSSLTSSLIPNPTHNNSGNSAGYVMTFGWDGSNVESQLYIPNGDHISTSYGRQMLYVRGKDSTWTNWYGIPYSDGTGATGTWGISITGSANYARYLTSPDTRSSNPAPTDYTATTTGVSFDFKQNSTISLNTVSSQTYSGVMTYRPYSSSTDWSGGPAHQIAFDAVGLYWRTGTSSWNRWYKIFSNERMPMNAGLTGIASYGNAYQYGSILYTNGLSMRDPSTGSGNDCGFIRHIETTSNSGYLEIGVGDDGNEPIYARQYNTSSAVVRTLTLLDASGNTTIPGRLFVSASDDVSNSSSSGALIIGSTSGASIGIDDNEIIARSSNAAGTLYLQNEGGAVTIGANTTINAALYMGGIVRLWGERYNGNYGMNANNSDIIGLNALKWADNSESYGEGLMFYRNGSSWDCMAASGGTFYFRKDTDGTPSLSTGNSNAALAAGYYCASTAATLSAGLPTPRETARAFLCGNGLFISGPYTSNDCGWIRCTSTSEANFQLEIATGDDGGAGEEIICRQYNTSNAVAHLIKLMDTGGNTLVNNLYVIGATTGTMGTGTTAPRIVFGEGSISNAALGCSYIQGVALAYTDWDAYRASKGLKVLDYDGNDNGNVWFEAQGHIYAAAVHSAVWNDYAECRKSDCNEPGYVIAPSKNGIAHKTVERLEPGCRIISDTWGHLIGESEEAKTPIAVSGRVLAYPYRSKTEYQIGDCVCSAPNGTIDIMTREEIMMYPDRIIGIVNEIPDYDKWVQTEPDGAKRTTIIEVKGRIWIDVK